MTEGSVATATRTNIILLKHGQCLHQDKEQKRDELGFFVGQYELEDANTGSSLAFPVVGVRIQFLQGIKSFGCIVELSHLENSL